MRRDVQGLLAVVKFGDKNQQAVIIRRGMHYCPAETQKSETRYS